jgi:hypothetical protein
MFRRAEASELIYTLCRDTVEVQRQLDAAWQADVCSIATSLADHSLTDLAHVFEGFAAAVVPRRCTVRSFEIDLRIVVGTTRERRFEVELAPLNAGYDRRYTTRHEAHSRLHVHVEQVPTEREADPPPRRHTPWPPS